MRASIFISAPIFAIAALAQSDSSATPSATSTVSNDNPFTSYLTQTNSLGVITGQPAVVTTQPDVVTTQPAVVTTQPLPATLPALASGFNTILVGNSLNQTSTIVVSVGNATTSIITPASSTPASGSAGTTGGGAAASGASGATGTAASASATHTGAASALQVAGGVFVGVGAFVAAFL